MQPPMETVVKTLRSLLNTTKNGLLEKQLRRDFREMEGYEIPYKSFGYNNLLDFLRASEEFDLNSTNDGMNIRARVSKNSQHIVELVVSQNRDRRKKSSKAMPFIPRFNSNANRNYSKPTTLNGRHMAQQYQPRRRPQQQTQNGTAFANRNSYNNSNSNNNYSLNASQSASSAANMKPNYNQNRDINWNCIAQQQPQIVEQIKQLQLLQAINIAKNMYQNSIRVCAQGAMQSNNVNANANASASANETAAANTGMSVPKPTVSVNTRLNPNFRSNQNISQITVPVEMKSTVPIAKDVSSNKEQWPKNDADEVIDLTKSPQPNHKNTQATNHHQMNSQPVCGTVENITTNDDNWKHDMYEKNQPFRKTVTNEMPQNLDRSNPKPEAGNVSKQDEKIASSWYSFQPKFNEPVKKSVFDRLCPKITNDQPTSIDNISKNVQSRLTVKPTTATIEKQSDTVDFVKQKQQEPPKPNPFHVDVATAIKQKVPPKVPQNECKTESEKDSSKDLLQIYCKQKNFDPPEYECERSRFKKFVGTVCVEGVKYSTAPLEYDDESRAEIAVAAKALENFKEFPISRDSSERIAQKIYDCIGDGGIFLKFLPNIFEQKYEESLPDGWPNIIQNRPEMFLFTQQPTNMAIVYKNTLKTESPSNEMVLPRTIKISVSAHEVAYTNAKATNDLLQCNEIEQKNDVDKLPPMKLPWDEPWWRIQTTAAFSPVDIWARNLDSEDWVHLSEALENIEDEFLSDFTRPKPCHDHEIIDGHLYLAVHKMPNIENPKKFDYHAFRVRVEEIDRIQKLALCFCIDDGYTEWLQYETKLFHLNRDLLKYPAQAIHFRLFNLDEFEENAYACEQIQSQLLDKSFVAKVKLTQADFEQQLDAVDSDDRISVMLLDTSASDEDRNVNKKVLEMICKQFEPPQLNPRSTNVVYVTHVCENGDVYCRLHGSKDMQLIKQSLHRILDRITDKHRVDSAQLMKNDSHKLHLIYDKSSQRYYRAIILPTDSKRLQPIAMCRCVDYGFVKRIPFEDIYDLERLSYVLSNLPYQALLVQLDGIDSRKYTADGIERMSELLYCHTRKPIYLNIVVRSEWPIVEACKMNDGSQYPVNGVIRQVLEISLDAVQLPKCDDSFSSSAESVHCSDEYLVLHPKPETNQIYDATVITALSPSLFYVRLNANDSTYNKMINCLWKDSESSEKIMSKKEIKLNHLYAGRWRDGYWHRVKVQAFSTNETVTVEKWDCGDIDQLSLDALRPLNETYQKLHQMIFCARLHDLQPRHNSWDKDDCERFRELTVGKMFKVEIKHIRCDADGNYITEVTLNTPTNINIGEVLVREQRAI